MTEPAQLSEGLTPAVSSGAQFTTTHWSMVLRAGDEDCSGCAAAMEQLCRVYWYPVYWFIRRHRANNHHDAEDLTQTFFAHLLERDTLTRADRDKGRFRTFLLGTLTKVLANEWDKKQTMKRGGGIQHLSIDEAATEGFYGAEPVEAETPEKGFDKHWAAALLRQSLERLRKEYHESGKDALFTALEPALTGEQSSGCYPAMAAQLNMSEATLRVTLHRLRVRFRELLRSEVAQTVQSNEEIDAELHHLWSSV
jgi:RNA polymerase sigma-70 factor (ECF subfamily)